LNGRTVTDCHGEVIVWSWVLTVYLNMLAAVIGSAGYAALFDADLRRANRGYRIFKITSSVGIVTVAVRLHELGVSA
jgi:hypothetical protein